MKINTNTIFEVAKYITPAEAVEYVADRAENRSEAGTIERMRNRSDAVEQMLGHLMEALIRNGVLRANQVEEIFLYDVSAED